MQADAALPAAPSTRSEELTSRGGAPSGSEAQASSLPASGGLDFALCNTVATPCSLNLSRCKLDPACLQAAHSEPQAPTPPDDAYTAPRRYVGHTWSPKNALTAATISRPTSVAFSSELGVLVRG